jgi:hypothetical protein
MTDPFVVLLLVAAGGASEPETSFMAAAARQALGTAAVLLFEERTSLPSEAQAVALAERVGAAAVVEVDWVGPLHTRALLHVRTAREADWVERQIDFAQSDPPSEYGRTVGFAIASMITRLSAPPPSPDLPASPPAPPTPEAAPSAASAESEPERPRPLPREADAPVDAPFGAKRAIELVAVASAPPIGIGGAASAFASVLPYLAVQVTGGVRFGSIPVQAPQAALTFSSVEVGGGATWRGVDCARISAQSGGLDVRGVASREV